MLMVNSGKLVCTHTGYVMQHNIIIPTPLSGVFRYRSTTKLILSVLVVSVSFVCPYSLSRKLGSSRMSKISWHTWGWLLLAAMCKALYLGPSYKNKEDGVQNFSLCPSIIELLDSFSAKESNFKQVKYIVYIMYMYFYVADLSNIHYQNSWLLFNKMYQRINISIHWNILRVMLYF